MTLTQTLQQHRERLFIKRCKTPAKTFIGGVVIGIFIGLAISAVFIDVVILK